MWNFYAKIKKVQEKPGQVDHLQGKTYLSQKTFTEIISSCHMHKSTVKFRPVIGGMLIDSGFGGTLKTFWRGSERQRCMSVAVSHTEHHTCVCLGKGSVPGVISFSKIPVNRNVLYKKV